MVWYGAWRFWYDRGAPGGFGDSLGASGGLGDTLGASGGFGDTVVFLVVKPLQLLVGTQLDHQRHQSNQ